jgi:hypothetical protein
MEALRVLPAAALGNLMSVSFPFDGLRYQAWTTWRSNARETRQLCPSEAMVAASGAIGSHEIDVNRRCLCLPALRPIQVMRISVA